MELFIEYPIPNIETNGIESKNPCVTAGNILAKTFYWSSGVHIVKESDSTIVCSFQV